MNDLIVAARQLIESMDDSDPERKRRAEWLWVGLWEAALQEVRQHNDRRLMDFMFDSGKPVPAECARQLLTLAGPRRRPPAILETPAQVVYRVRMAIIRGHRYESLEKAENNPAFVAVARQLNCTPAAVQHHYRKCPAAQRKTIRNGLERARQDKAFLRAFKHLGSLFENAPTAEVEREAHAALWCLIEKRKSSSGGGK